VNYINTVNILICKSYLLNLLNGVKYYNSNRVVEKNKSYTRCHVQKKKCVSYT